MKLDVLITTAHPDDAEAAMGGTILKLLAAGKKVGICDFTRGELGTRGSAELRAEESAEADRRLGLTARLNLGFRDGFFTHDEAHLLAVVKAIRQFQPDILFTNPPDDRHPDHGRAHSLAVEAAFLAGLRRVETFDDTGQPQQVWRPGRVFHYIQSRQPTPDFVVDISDYWEKKKYVLKAYASQFYCEENSKDEDGPATVISGQDFWNYFQARAHVMGRSVNVDYGEGFLSHQPLKITDVTSLL